MGSSVGLTVRALGAFAIANVRYWLTVAGETRRQLRHWEGRANAIAEPRLREIAIEKLHEEGFNAEVAAVMATLAPRRRRRQAVRAIVALELLFDCLDGMTELPHADPLKEGQWLFGTFTGAIDPEQRLAVTLDPYLLELARAVSDVLVRLPASEAVAGVARRCAVRSAQAQIRMHASAALGTSQLEDWARSEAPDGALGWREFAAAAASSVLTLHVLIAAACDPRTTSQEAELIEKAYLPFSAVVTLLDGVVDQTVDATAKTSGYIALYEGPTPVAEALTRSARQATTEFSALQHRGYHLTMLACAVAYWTTTPGAREEPAAATLAGLRGDMRLLLPGPLLLMRVWRSCRAAKGRLVQTQAAVRRLAARARGAERI